MNEPQESLRAVMIQIASGKLLLPNAAIAEILSVADPEPLDDVPDWLLGQIRWRGWQVPLVSFTRLAGLGETDRYLRGQRVLVLKTLGGRAERPYVALLTQGFPRLVTVNAATLEELEAPTDPLFAAHVRYQDEEAIVPDLDALETQLQDALAA